MPAKKNRGSGRPRRGGAALPKPRAARPVKAGASPGPRTSTAPAATPAPKPRTASAANLTVADLGRVWERIGLSRRLTEFRVSCVRPDDLLVCDFVFEKLRLELRGEGAPKLVREPNEAATLIVELPPQSFGEEAYLDATGKPGKDIPGNLDGAEKFPESSPVVKNRAHPGETIRPMPAARVRMAGRSRIAFSMPAEETELTFTVEAILGACRRWPMRLDVNAVPDPTFGRFDDFGFRDPWLAAVAASSSWVASRVSNRLNMSADSPSVIFRGSFRS